VRHALTILSSSARALAIATLAAALVACGGGGSDAPEPSSQSPSPSPAPSPSPTPPAANTAPTISGTPAATASVGVAYQFQPNASDAEGSALSFTIQNQPGWATFSTQTGRLSGTPASGNVGTFAGIVISVSDGALTASLPAFTIAVSAAAAPPNRPPTITGSPPSAATVGSAYAFQPTASDPDGNPLTFAIQNRPAWATFSTSTGRLSGTPAVGDIGTVSGVLISVSDGTATVSLPAFSITVAQVATGSATLNWTAPTLNTDGSPLTNLSGYQILYGSSPGALSRTIQVTNPSVTTYVVDNLSSGTWYFAIRTLAGSGQTSAQTNVASRVIP
jgi:hypothetical protein